MSPGPYSGLTGPWPRDPTTGALMVSGSGKPYGLTVGKGGCVVPTGLRAHASFSTRSDGVITVGMFRFFVPLSDPTATVVLPAFGNWVDSGSSAASPYYHDGPAPNAITFAAAIETDDGNVVPFSFGNKHLCTLDPAENAVMAWPDQPLSIGAAVTSNGHAGFWMRTYVTVTSGGKWGCNIAGTGLGTGDTYRGSSTGTITDLTLPGSAAVSAGSGLSVGWGPVLVMTKAGVTRKPIIAACGDSIFDGYSEPFATSYYGPVARACEALGFGAVRATAGGESTVQFSTTSGRRYRAPLLEGCTHAILELGTNDGLSTLLNATQAMTRLTTIGNWMKNTLGISDIAISTVPPRTSSTDSWATTGNQTAISNIAALAQLNQAIRALPAPFTKVIDMEGLCSSAQDSGLWAVGATTDGVHPVGALMAGTIPAAVQSAISGWTVN